MGLAGHADDSVAEKPVKQASELVSSLFVPVCEDTVMACLLLQPSSGKRRKAQLGK